MSTGHGSVVCAGENVSATPVPGIAGAVSPVSSDTASPSGTDPGCQVTVARASAVTTAPAAPGCATSGPGTAAGTRAAAITAVVGAPADCDPPFPVAVTTSESVVPMSPGVRT